jgi:hypothetical protein
VRGDDLGDLVLVGEDIDKVGGSGEVARATLLLRERLVGHVADEVLEKAVLAVLRRRRVGLDTEDLLTRQRGEEWIELRLR